MLLRELNLPKKQHFFLFGARQTGKTTLIRKLFGGKNLQEYNLLLGETFTKLAAEPHILREEIAALPPSVNTIFIDEVQRIPALLNEVQFLIDQKERRQFILSGSSARKLRRGRGNLLAGRAWTYNLFPLTLHEVGTTKLSELLTFGTLPQNIASHSAHHKEENLRSYVEVYLKEEIEAEALSRNIGGFIRFLATAAQTNGEQINYSNIARDVGVSSVTVKEYYKILEDTLIGSFLMPFSFSQRKRHKLSPKFYFFDTGVLRAAQKRLSLPVQAKSFEFGNYFETWVINEANRISSYLRKDFSFSFLRTANDVEVDLIIEKPNGEILAIEIKSKTTPVPLDFMSGFQAIKKIIPKAKCLCVCAGKSSRVVNGYKVVPYQEFFQMLRE